MLNGGLVKTERFRKPKYVGDPINAVRIFNDKEVDELIFLDIGAPRSGSEPDFDLLTAIAGEAFMPFSYGGGVRTVEHARRLYGLGTEKVVLNTAAAEDPGFVAEVAALAGSSGVVVSIDARRRIFGGWSVFSRAGERNTGRDPIEYARTMESAGAGELFLNSIEHDGTRSGYALDLLRSVANAVDVPVVAAGGAGELRHFRQAVDAGAAAVSAGSMFVFHGKHRAVLITYPRQSELDDLFS